MDPLATKRFTTVYSSSNTAPRTVPSAPMAPLNTLAFGEDMFNLDQRETKSVEKEGRMSIFFASVKMGIQQSFDFNGMSSRTDFWFFMLFFMLLYLVVALIDEATAATTINLLDLPLGNLIPMGMVDSEVGLLVLLYRPIMVIPTTSATVRRLHDAGRSGWWALLWVLPIPVLGWIYLIPLLCKPSKIKPSTTLRS